jgi:hypothetical protein
MDSVGEIGAVALRKMDDAVCEPSVRAAEFDLLFRRLLLVDRWKVGIRQQTPDAVIVPVAVEAFGEVVAQVPWSGGVVGWIECRGAGRPVVAGGVLVVLTELVPLRAGNLARSQAHEYLGVATHGDLDMPFEGARFIQLGLHLIAVDGGERQLGRRLAQPRIPRGRNNKSLLVAQHRQQSTIRSDLCRGVEPYFFSADVHQRDEVVERGWHGDLLVHIDANANQHRRDLKALGPKQSCQ